MLQEKDCPQVTHTIQISTRHKYASICFSERYILEAFSKTKHLLTDTYVKFEPDYNTRIRISIENLPIELPDKEVKTLL